jgi:IclR family transcriptional regulator, KDG regulon repressor
MASRATDGHGRSASSDLYVRSVARAVSILECFTLDNPELNLTEVSNSIGLSKSTTHRLLSTLESAEMVEFDKKTAHYRLGLKVFQLGSVVAKSMELVKQADPLLMNLAADTDETAFLLVADGNEALCLRRFDGMHHVRVLFLEAGKRATFNCGAAQRVLLAHMPEARWEEIIANHVRRMTQYSLATREELERDRREIRERGYSVSWEDVTLHACALGAPVRDTSGNVIAAVSISGIVQRFSAERLPGLIRTIMEVGDELSRRLGHAGEDAEEALLGRARAVRSAARRKAGSGS